MYAYDDPLALLNTYDLAMDAVAEWGGYPPVLREAAGVHTLYLMPDLLIATPLYGTGYPQTNVLYDPETDYGGNYDFWVLRDPVGWSTTWHELGHTQQRQEAKFQYAAETEAIVNFLWCYVEHVKFSVPFNEAFKTTRGGDGQYEPDDAAVHWMITENFRNGNEMNRDDPNQEYQYQHRGYAKYADIARLFGWDAYTGAYHQENLDFEAGVTGPGATLAGYGYQARTLRLSIQAGYDLTPLIHFWGIHPLEPDALAAEHSARALGPSTKVRCLLLRYRELVPADNAEFNAFFERVYPGRPSDPNDNPGYGRGWYNAWRDTFNETHGAAAKAQVDAVLALYFSGTVLRQHRHWRAGRRRAQASVPVAAGLLRCAGLACRAALAAVPAAHALAAAGAASAAAASDAAVASATIAALAARATAETTPPVASAAATVTPAHHLRPLPRRLQREGHLLQRRRRQRLHDVWLRGQLLPAGLPAAAHSGLGLPRRRRRGACLLW